MKTPMIFNADSYKVSHWMQVPDGMEYMQSYIESRGGFSPNVLFFGLQKYIKDNLLTPVTLEDVRKAKLILDAHLGEGIFNEAGWLRLIEKHNGLPPIRIRAIREGMVVPIKTALVTVENTDPEFHWMVSYYETSILRDVWYGSTVATISKTVKDILTGYLDKYSDDKDAINFMFHDFGARGVSTDGGSQMGGMAHLINFKGTDTMASLIAAIEYYNVTGVMGFSVIASEHSTTCLNSDPETKDDYKSIEKMVSILEQRCRITGSFQIVSAVADTYNVYRYVKYLSDFKDRIVATGGRYVVRPDSGDVRTVAVDLVKILMDDFGYTVNSKGMKVLPSCIRVLQGDGINFESMKAILDYAVENDISPCNFVFGAGGFLLQHCDRDWMKFAMKCSAARINGVWIDVFKDPITDSGKTSKKGRLTTIRTIGDVIKTVRIEEVGNTDVDLMGTVYENGALIREQTFEEIIQTANIFKVAS